MTSPRRSGGAESFAHPGLGCGFGGGGGGVGGFLSPISQSSLLKNMAERFFQQPLRSWQPRLVYVSFAMFDGLEFRPGLGRLQLSILVPEKLVVNEDFLPSGDQFRHSLQGLRRNKEWVSHGRDSSYGGENLPASRVLRPDAPSCHGAGRSKSYEELQVSIPCGVTSGKDFPVTLIHLRIEHRVPQSFATIYL